ncbi:MAG: hypothetical protein WCT07_01160 [Candidatus Paceibacterota bacterium]|jgi:hypothetical protein
MNNNNHLNICECGHDAMTHKSLKSFEDGSVPFSVKQAICDVSDCGCKQYIFNKKICTNCNKDLKQSQYARAIGSDGVIPKAKDCLVCRNYPDCEKAEKDC